MQKTFISLDSVVNLLAIITIATGNIIYIIRGLIILFIKKDSLTLENLFLNTGIRKNYINK